MIGNYNYGQTALRITSFARTVQGRNRPWKRRLVAEGTGRIDCAQQQLQQMDGTAGLESIGMGADAAHGMHGDRPCFHAFVVFAGAVGPGDR